MASRVYLGMFNGDGGKLRVRTFSTPSNSVACCEGGNFSIILMRMSSCDGDDNDDDENGGGCGASDGGCGASDGGDGASDGGGGASDGGGETNDGENGGANEAGGAGTGIGVIEVVGVNTGETGWRDGLVVVRVFGTEGRRVCDDRRLLLCKESS